MTVSLPITHPLATLTDLYLLSAQEHLLDEQVSTEKNIGA